MCESLTRSSLLFKLFYVERMQSDYFLSQVESMPVEFVVLPLRHHITTLSFQYNRGQCCDAVLTCSSLVLKGHLQAEQSILSETSRGRLFSVLLSSSLLLSCRPVNHKKLSLKQTKTSFLGTTVIIHTIWSGCWVPILLKKNGVHLL